MQTQLQKLPENGLIPLCSGVTKQQYIRSYGGEHTVKKTAKTALTAAVFAAALGVSAAGSIPAEAETQQYLAATDQHALQVLYGPGPNYQPPVAGDMNDDRVLDARDLSMMKQAIIRDSQKDYDEYETPSYTGISARILTQKLTGENENPQHPVCFTVYLKPVAYFDAPESDEERQALEEAAQDRLGSEVTNEIFRVTDPGTGKCFRLNLSGSSYLSRSFGKCFTLELPDGFLPNAEENGAALHRSEVHWSVTFQKYGTVFVADEGDESNGPVYVYSPHIATVKEFSANIVTFRSDPEAGDVYYDKCLLEWNVNTDEIRVGPSLTMDKAQPE